jgi:hypothetical protein
VTLIGADLDESPMAYQPSIRAKVFDNASSFSFTKQTQACVGRRQ